MVRQETTRDGTVVSDCGFLLWRKRKNKLRQRTAGAKVEKEDLLGRPIKDGEGLASAHVLRWGGSDQADTLCGEERENDVAGRGPASTEHAEARGGA